METGRQGDREKGGVEGKAFSRGTRPQHIDSKCNVMVECVGFRAAGQGPGMRPQTLQWTR